MAQAASSETNEVVNLLALDGGGIRGISELLILHEIMRRVQHDRHLDELPRPCDYFHLIGGTSTGGLIALMLGRLRMRTDEALEMYNSLAKAIFSKENKKWKGQDGTFKASTLEKEVKELVSRKALGERMLDLSTPTTKAKAFVCAMPARNMEYPRRFRTYAVRELASVNCEIWEAARATSAAPTFFKRIVIGDGSGGREEFIDGGLGCNNPAKQVLEEAKSVFGTGRAVACLVSIGTGHPGTIGLAQPDTFQKILPTKVVGVVKKIATDCSTIANELYDRFKDHERFYYRFNVEHGAEGISLEEWEKMGELTTHTNAYMRNVAVSKAIDEVVAILCHSQTANRTIGSLDGVSSLQSFSVSFSISEVTEISFFTAREKELKNIHAKLNMKRGRHTVVVHGMGGIGKTQITIAYAKQHRDDYSAIFWLNCKDEDSLKRSFLRLAQRILREHPSTVDLVAIKRSEGLDVAVDAVKRWCDRAENTRWLLIYDNYDNAKLPGVDDPTTFDIRQYLPEVDHGSIIITTRQSQVTVGDRIELKKLGDIGDSLRILELTSDRDDLMKDKDARKVAERLDGLPLALSSAGMYLREVGTTFAGYLELYEKSWLKLQQKTPISDAYDRALYSTWQLSYSHIEGQNRRAAKLFQLWAYFDRQDLWFELLQEGRHSKHIPAWFFKLVEDELNFTEAIRVIRSHGLIAVDMAQRMGATESQGYSMHSCVHEWTIHVLNQQWDNELIKLALKAVAAHTPEQTSKNYWIIQRRLMPHAARCWSLVNDGLTNGSYLPNVFYQFGNLYLSQEKINEAEQMYLRALDENETVLGEDRILTLGTVNNLGIIYRKQHKFKDAEQMFLQALAGTEQERGPNHISTLSIAGNLGHLYRVQHKFEEAEQILLRVLAGKEQELGSNAISTFQAVYDLGLLYSDQRKFDEAEQMLISALAGIEKVLGLDDPFTLQVVNNVGGSYKKQGRFGDAEKMYLRALAGTEKMLGREDPLAPRIARNLDRLYREQGKLDESERLHQRFPELESEATDSSAV